MGTPPALLDSAHCVLFVFALFALGPVCAGVDPPAPAPAPLLELELLELAAAGKAIGSLTAHKRERFKEAERHI